MIGRSALACLIGVLGLTGAASFAAAQTGGSFTPFDAFLKQVAGAPFEAAAAAPQSKVADRPEFERMRTHVLSLYKGVVVTHSFVDDGQTYDCVPIAHQPSLNVPGAEPLASPPPFPPGADDGSDAKTPGVNHIEATQEDTTGRFDAFGNPMSCESASFPMRRVTLEEISRFGTLRNFLRKIPLQPAQEKKVEGESDNAAAATPHKYAHAYEYVRNYGGTSELNLWTPNVKTAKGEYMSLSRHWYAGSLGGLDQTAEGGWQNQPLKWGVDKSVLFIYWTADGYNQTGCYNTDCVGFVQQNKTVVLGKGFTHYSTQGGTQYEFKLTYQFHGGAWWLGVGSVWVGYFPASLYGSGTMRTHSSEIDYGGETVGSPTYPPMGSGKFAASGDRHAAYQRLIRYITKSLTGASSIAKLTPSQTSPACYTIGVHNKTTSSWGTYFYFGGPGGSRC